MERYHVLDGRAYVARYGWHGRVKGSAVLILGVVLAVAFLVADWSSFWTVVGELWLVALFATVLWRTAGPALRRDVAVAIDAPGIVLGGLGFWGVRQVLIPWSQVTRVRLYEYDWIDTHSDGGNRIHYYPTVHIDRGDGQVARTVTTSAGVDAGRLRDAVVAFASQVPVSIEGHVGFDPLTPKDGVRAVFDPLLNFADRLRARRGRPRLPRSPS